MRFTHTNDMLAVHGKNYTLTFPTDRAFVYLDDAKGQRIAELFVLSSVHPMNGRDDTTKIEPWIVRESAAEITCELHAASLVWKSKTYRFHCCENRFAYEIEINGYGELAEVDYFGGYSSAQLTWGSGFFWSGQYFKRGFNPEPNTEEQNYFLPTAGSMIDLVGVNLPGKGDWFFTPPPFCFAFETDNGWLALGVQAEPGAHRFTEYAYHTQLGFHLSLSYDGHTHVDGTYRLPAIGFDFAADEFAALQKHVDVIAGIIPGCHPERSEGSRPPQYKMLRTKCVRRFAQHDRITPAWWREPIFCGWGAQGYVAAVRGTRTMDECRQENYDEFLCTLEGQGIHPGVVVIDDKWSTTYGENMVDENKWHDLSGFIAQQHMRGRHVLLWLKMWDPEGLPSDECITNAAGLPLSCDPSNPKFEKRLRESIRQMLSHAGYDADGFKIDFSARIPAGYGICTHGDLWGLELMRLYFEIIYDEAKKAKSDALIMTHTPHPYLADVLDMIRLNDINPGKDTNPAMILRARVARIACPNAVIDTDNWPQTNRAAWREYLPLQLELGVPSLYSVTHIDTTLEPLEECDYALIRDLWAKYRAKLVA
ncbi:MAG: hypothetical protein HZB51_14270 [Chloroflexi bacterium]|nr:hypothetical protein [Chloroflexota bacterium]